MHSVLKDCNNIGNLDQAKEIYTASDSHVVFTVMGTNVPEAIPLLTMHHPLVSFPVSFAVLGQ